MLAPAWLELPQWDRRDGRHTEQARSERVPASRRAENEQTTRILAACVQLLARLNVTGVPLRELALRAQEGLSRLGWAIHDALPLARTP